MSSNTVNQINDDLNAVKIQMTRNIEGILERGENIATIVQRSDQISNNAQIFSRTARDIKTKMWWQNLKMWIFIYSKVVLLRGKYHATFIESLKTRFRLIRGLPAGLKRKMRLDCNFLYRLSPERISFEKWIFINVSHLTFELPPGNNHAGDSNHYQSKMPSFVCQTTGCNNQCAVGNGNYTNTGDDRCERCSYMPGVPSMLGGGILGVLAFGPLGLLIPLASAVGGMATDYYSYRSRYRCGVCCNVYCETCCIHQ
ncbi:hypothetical protein I4U23_016667 [Adineta vaga]|nr:hypothetical protein I4U23_016667 [Adineta vaga]